MSVNPNSIEITAFKWVPAFAEGCARPSPARAGRSKRSARLSRPARPATAARISRLEQPFDQVPTFATNRFTSSRAAPSFNISAKKVTSGCCPAIRRAASVRFNGPMQRSTALNRLS